MVRTSQLVLEFKVNSETTAAKRASILMEDEGASQAVTSRHHVCVLTCSKVVDSFYVVKNYIAKPEMCRVRQQVDDISCELLLNMCRGTSKENSINIQSAEAFIVLYDRTKPSSMALYNTLVRTLIDTDKVVRVVGVTPDRSYKKQVVERTTSSMWGDNHTVIQDGVNGIVSLRGVFFSIARQLLTGSSAATVSSDKKESNTDKSRCSIM